MNDKHVLQAGADPGNFTNEKDMWGSLNGDQWFYGKVLIDLKEGENKITIAGRESGFVLRQIMLSPVQQSSLEGWLNSDGQPAAIAIPPTVENQENVLVEENGPDKVLKEPVAVTPAVPESPKPDTYLPEVSQPETSPLPPVEEEVTETPQPDDSTEEKPVAPEATQPEVTPETPVQEEAETVSQPEIALSEEV